MTTIYLCVNLEGELEAWKQEPARLRCAYQSGMRWVQAWRQYAGYGPGFEQITKYDWRVIGIGSKAPGERDREIIDSWEDAAE